MIGIHARTSQHPTPFDPYGIGGYYLIEPPRIRWWASWTQSAMLIQAHVAGLQAVHALGPMPQDPCISDIVNEKKPNV